MAGSNFRRFGRLVKWDLGLCCRLSGECAGKEADRFYLVSTRDWEAILALAGSEAVDGVLAFASDPAELTAAYVAEGCGLPRGPRDASGIIGILYFYFANREEAESYLSQIRCCLVVHVAAIAEVWSRKRNRMGRFFMQLDLQENILRMGEYMRPAFTERERSGIDVRAYAKKLTDRAEIHVAVNEKDEIVGMIAAYLNRKDYGLL